MQKKKKTDSLIRISIIRKKTFCPWDSNYRESTVAQIVDNFA